MNQSNQKQSFARAVNTNTCEKRLWKNSQNSASKRVESKVVCSESSYKIPKATTLKNVEGISLDYCQNCEKALSLARENNPDRCLTCSFVGVRPKQSRDVKVEVY